MEGHVGRNWAGLGRQTEKMGCVRTKADWGKKLTSVEGVSADTKFTGFRSVNWHISV